MDYGLLIEVFTRVVALQQKPVHLIMGHFQYLGCLYATATGGATQQVAHVLLYCHGIVFYPNLPITLIPCVTPVRVKKIRFSFSFQPLG